MQYRHLKLGSFFQNESPFICQSAPLVGSKNTVIHPLIVEKLPFVWNNGFNLIELIITLTIAGVLLAVAAPSMSSFVMNNRLASQVNELLADINLSRSEAIKRNTDTGICVTAVNGAACVAAGNWANGWLVYYVDPVTTAKVTIKVHEQLSGNSTLLLAPVGDTVAYSKNGLLNGAADVAFTLCNPKYGKSRVVTILTTGRPAISENTC